MGISLSSLPFLVYFLFLVFHPWFFLGKGLCALGFAFLLWLFTPCCFLSFSFSLSLMGPLTQLCYSLLSHPSLLSYPRLACFEPSLFLVTFMHMTKHPFHIVSPSPWPIFVAGSLFLFVPLFIFSWSHIRGS